MQLAENNKKIIFSFLLAIFFIELIRTAWISDDAAITLRSVLNFTNGYGPNFNIGERVQAYTHPLWFLLISVISKINSSVFYTTFFLSISLSIFAFYLVFIRVAIKTEGAIIACATLLLSKSYLDYSTSGLENPLSHLLIILVFLLGLRVIEKYSTKTLSVLSGYFFSCSLLYLSRPDLLLIFFPLTLLIFYESKVNKSILGKAILIGAIPAVAWTAFSLFYYGFPFSNTAYAKLGTGIPLGDRIIQGIRYFLDSISRDPLTIVAIFFGTLSGFSNTKTDKALSLGLISYIAYVVGIGGDFMSGRFLTAPLLVATILIARSKISQSNFFIILIGTLTIALPSISGTLLSDANYQNTKIGSNGIADERGYYFQRYGLINANKETFKTPVWRVEQQETSRYVRVTCGGLGFAGIKGGPQLHLIDYCGLTDALLARLPAKHDDNWRIGHFLRQLPENYEASVEQGRNLLTDPDINSLYEEIRNISGLPLTDSVRLRSIANINLKSQKLNLDKYRVMAISQSTDIPAIMATELVHPIKNGSVWDKPGHIIINRAIDIVLESRHKLSGFDISLDGNDRYRIEYYSNGLFHNQIELGPENPVGGGMFTYNYRAQTASSLVDRIRITPLWGDSMYSIGHIYFHTQP
jgi:arabinofuranosyltransferase